MTRFNLKDFTNSKKLASFSMFKQAFEQIIFAFKTDKEFSCIDVLNISQDISASVCIGQAFDRLDEDLESYGTVDVLLWCHEVDKIYYSLLHVCNTDTTQHLCLELMITKVNQIIIELDKIIATV